MKKYDVAAFIWPAYTGDEERTRIFWPEGIGEWQTVKNVRDTLVNKPGYHWDRKPLWGYVNEADPYVMEMQIEAALDHGVNVFIYDWYWFDNRPFLENCLNDGFLKAKNHDKMKFYLMWANHTADTTWDRRTAHEPVQLWEGKGNFEQVQVIGRHWIEKYFCLPCYYKIDGKPVVSIYDVRNFMAGFGGMENARKALDWLDEEVKKAGHPGVHVQMIKTEIPGIPYKDVMKGLGFDSWTHYQFRGITSGTGDYMELMPQVLEEWDYMREGVGKPFFPHVSIGWDNNPRYMTFRPDIMTGSTPETFEYALRKAKEYCDTYNQTPLITINSWNEWTETSYLEPDNVFGYGYLEAVKRVFCEE